MMTQTSNEQQFFGLEGLDRRLAGYLPQATGFFIELGAFDGVTQNNTLYFERRAWRGLLIEPVPEIYRRCLLNRPLATVVNCACVAADYELPDVAMVSAGLMSIIKGARKSREADDEWVRRAETLQKLQSRHVRVPARTLSSVIDEHHVGRIDLLSLDVEGYELDVLRGLDFDRHRPVHILVEESDTGDIEAYLTGRDYQIVALLSQRRFGRDVLYRDPQQVP